MTKQELIQAIKDHPGSPYRVRKGEVETVVNLALELITSSLANDEDVALTGFGKFAAHDRAARTGRNPQTGEAIEIPASITVKFTPGKGLKEAVN
ncbi:MAG: HU family DNA-binding protein [Proteobacteria bacterium]|nr:HU family DNA-binding protein [Pseudomonadota bacterium]